MKKKIMAAFLAAATAMTLLAGCSGGSDSGKDNQSSGSADSAEASDEGSGELDTVNVAYMPNYASLWVVATADEKGYFEEEGIEVVMTKFDDGPQKSQLWNPVPWMWLTSDQAPIHWLSREMLIFSVSSSWVMQTV